MHWSKDLSLPLVFYNKTVYLTLYVHFSSSLKLDKKSLVVAQIFINEQLG